MVFGNKLTGLVGRMAFVYVCLFVTNTAMAQSDVPQLADKIVAVVGRNIILQSELDNNVAQMKQGDPNFSDSCGILQNMVTQKMMVEQADRDSVVISDEEVEGQLENRLRYFVQQYGSKDKLEQMSGKTIYQLKEDNRAAIKDQMIADKMQTQVLENVKITPAEVKVFYNKIPVDSLPFFPATVEVGQIVIDPPVSHEIEQLAHEKIEDIRKQIVNGDKTFEMAAMMYSADPGSRDNGGRYDGVTRNGPWAPEFLNATFKLQNGEISPIVKTKFGYHIIQMIDRKGDEADVRHILIRPDLTSGDFQTSLNKLDSIRNLLVSGKMGFPEAVGKYSTDESAKRTGGMITDPNTGSSMLDVAKLDPSMVIVLDSMQVGGFSQPQIFFTDAHERSCRIVYLKTRTPPHKANLQDDYSRIQEVALQQKKTLKLQDWVLKKMPTYYLKVDPQYQSCGQIKDWLAATAVK